MATKEKKDLTTVLSKTKTNKLRKLEKHIKNFPGDKAAKEKFEALSKGSDQFTPRKKPVNKNGWINSILSNGKLNFNQVNSLKNKLRPEKRKFELMETAKYLKADSKI